MADFNFGDVTEIVCQHSIAGTTSFYPKANESFTIDLGGIRANDDESQLTSDGQMMSQLNRKRAFFEGVIAVDMASNRELNKLQQMNQSPILGTWSISNIAGVTYRGVGRQVGDMQIDSNAGTITLKVAFSRALEKIS